TVRPGGVLAGRRARRIEQRRLRQEDERSIADAAAPRVALRRGDLVERPADVHRRGARARGSTPRDGRVERPVHLERAHAVAEALEPPAVAGRKAVTREAKE